MARTAVAHGQAIIAAALIIAGLLPIWFGWQMLVWFGLLVGCALGLVFLGHRRPARLELWAIGGILASMALSPLWAHLWGPGDWGETFAVVAWTGSLAVLFWGRDHKLILWYLMPFLVLHALVLFTQGALGFSNDQWGARVAGLHINPNPAAALLLFGLIMAAMWDRRYSWMAMALPFALALPWTGSRWALISLGLVLIVMFFYHRRRAVLLGAIVALGFAVGLAVDYQQVQGNYLRGGGLEKAVEDSNRRTLDGFELTWADLPGRGYVPLDVGEYHNVPLRMMAQYGVVSALLWLGLVALRLWQWRDGGLGFWLVLLVLVLSMQDHYFIVGQLAPLMWLLLGWQRDASLEEARAARNRLAKVYHPDSGTQPDTQRMAEINAAYGMAMGKRTIAESNSC